MNKKAQTAWTTEELAKLVLRISAVLVLLVIMVAIISIFTKPRPINTIVTDTKRVAAELQELRPGDDMTVPIFSNDGFVAVAPSKTTRSAGLNLCEDEKDYCVCALEDDDKILECINIDQSYNLEIDTTEGNEFSLSRDYGMRLTADDEKIIII